MAETNRLTKMDVLDETTAAGVLSRLLADSTVKEVERIINGLAEKGWEIVKSKKPTAFDTLPDDYEAPHA